MRGRFGYRSSSGFTIMELVFGFLILAVLLALTINNLRFSIDKEGPRGLAFTVASELRAARAEAQRSGNIVAVCFPSEGRTNSVSKSAIVRKGEQRGHISKILSYGSEYDAFFFLGSWPDSEVDSTHDLPISWSISTTDAMAIYFRPDGSAFSNEIPAIDGNYPLVVASSFRGELSGPEGELTHAKNPHTVWVSSSGSISVEEGKVPSGTLPPGESELVAAELELSNEPSPSTPVILFKKFLPEKVDGLETASVGQNYVSVHPNQKEGGYLEYGIATIEIKAKDADGGPLTYTLEATASAGDSGEFTVSNLQGQMRYVYDEVEKDHVWHAVISWRPPPGSPPDLEYKLAVFVNDPDENSVEISTDAGLLPKVTSLPPARVVMSTTDKKLYLANLDGSNEIEITKNGPEVLPFFSADGSRLFSFYDYTEGTQEKRELRARIPNGTSSFDRLATFDNDEDTTIHFDPTFTFAAMVVPDGNNYFPYLYVWSEEEDSGGEDGGTRTVWYSRPEASEPKKYKILMINLMSEDPPVQVADNVRGPDDFKWAGAENRYTFAFGTRSALTEPVPLGGQFIGIKDPGYEDTESAAYKLVGHPPAKELFPAGFEGEATNRVYNPADPNWYLEVEGSSLYLRDTARTTDIALSSAGSFENDHAKRKTPSWSANGEQVAFIESPGGSSKLVSMTVLDSKFDPVGPTTNCTITGSLSSAQLSPEGEWVYYLQGGQLFRAKGDGTSRVNISSRISGSLNGYVISP